MVGGFALAQGDSDPLDVGIGLHGQLGDGLVVVQVELALFDAAGALGLEEQGLLEVFLVGDDGVHVLDQLGHHLVGGLAVLPEVLAVVQVAAHVQAQLLGGLHCSQGEVRRGLADGRGDAGDVEPGGAGHDLFPVDGVGLGFGDGAARAVIDDLAGTLDGAGLQIIDAHAAGLIDDGVHVHAEAAELPRAGAADVVVGQNGDEGGVHPVVGQGNGDVGFAAAEGGFQHRALHQTLVAGAL